MEYIAALLFALAVSADGFAAGVAYGIKRIHIPVTPLLVIAVSSAAAVSVSMVFGTGLAAVLDPRWASHIGAFLLIAIGCYFLMGAFRETINNLEIDPQEPLLSFSIKTLGIIVHILKEPSTADFDSSGEISVREAAFLGLALALDALGAGVGIALTGMNILFTALCVGMLKFILVYSGIWIGQYCKGSRVTGAASLLSGFILVVIGLMEFM
jgi:putative sporulation protein YtaF